MPNKIVCVLKLLDYFGKYYSYRTCTAIYWLQLEVKHGRTENDFVTSLLLYCKKKFNSCVTVYFQLNLKTFSLFQTPCIFQLFLWIKILTFSLLHIKKIENTFIYCRNISFEIYLFKNSFNFVPVSFRSPCIGACTTKLKRLKKKKNAVKLFKCHYDNGYEKMEASKLIKTHPTKYLDNCQLVYSSLVFPLIYFILQLLLLLNKIQFFVNHVYYRAFHATFISTDLLLLST